MAGYDGFSKSNNALDAEASGLRTASRIDPRIPARLVKEYCRYEEWHHTSSRYNQTEYYNPEYVMATFGLIESEDYEVNPRAVEALSAHQASGGDERVIEGCEVVWLEWSGTRNHPHATERKETGCTVTIKGQTATIRLQSGVVIRKRLSTKGFRFSGASNA